MRRIAFVLFASVAAAPAAPVAPAAQAPYAIPPGAERAYAAVKDRVDPDAAMGIVRIMDSYWRLAGNPGFNASIESIQAALGAAGLAPRVDAFPARSRGWDASRPSSSLTKPPPANPSRSKRAASSLATALRMRPTIACRIGPRAVS